jgi:uncharacterized protein (DUF1501 family)
MEWTRRAFMKGSGLALFSASFGGTPLFLSRAADAANNPLAYSRRKTLVTIFQRGAMDGLMAVTPFNDPALAVARPNLFMSLTDAENKLTDLDGRFALHPAFADMAPLYKEGRLAIVHGIGSPNKTRSHFDAQDYMETGTPGVKGTRSGWLNRAVGLLGHEGTPFRSVALTKRLPRSYYGKAPSIAVNDLRSFGIQMPGNAAAADDIEAGFEAMYARSAKRLVQKVSSDSFDAIEMLEKVDLKSYKPADGAKYPSSQLGRRLQQIAMLVKSDVGLEVAFTEAGGWDTHVQQGTTGGSFSNKATDLSQAISAFWTDLGTYQDDVVLMTMTEFGRTVHQNGSMGTDHGRGSCLFVLGNNVDGGKVYGNVPEKLEQDALEDRRDLPVTTDFRSVFSEVAGKHLNFDVSQDNVLFPGWEGERFKLMT